MKVSSVEHAELIRDDIIAAVEKRTPIYAVDRPVATDVFISARAESVGTDD